MSNQQLIKLSKNNNIIAAFVNHWKLKLIDYDLMLKQLTLTLWEITNTLIDEYDLRKLINPIKFFDLNETQTEADYIYFIKYIKVHLECLFIYIKSHEIEVNTIKNYMINNNKLNEVNIKDITMLDNLLFN